MDGEGEGMRKMKGLGGKRMKWEEGWREVVMAGGLESEHCIHD